MKFSLKWVKEFTDITLPVATLVEKIGAQLGGVEEVTDYSKKYQGVVIAKVVHCTDHPDADRLHVCLIDDGGKTADVARNADGLVQVVCGAPNVREGLLVAWLPPKTTVPSSYDHEPFVLEVRELRGVMSNGMLASPKELGLGDSHEGLLEVDADCQLGDLFAAVFDLDDTVVDIENKMFTHRPDCFGQLGIARELAGITGTAFTSPEWYTMPAAPASTDGLAYTVANEIPELCPRYMLAAIDNVTVAPSPIWLQSLLTRAGVRSINNIVDMTNYMMLLTGQPLHAFDYDKVAKNGSAQIVVRRPRSGEKMTLLDGKEITPREDAILICDAEKPIALGGVMGGNNSEIDVNTKRILIECANFDMYSIRRTSMQHGLFTDAVSRFNKGQSEWQCPAVLYKAMSMVQELCAESKASGAIIDKHQPNRKNQPVAVSMDFINQRLGLSLTTEAIETLLENVEFVTAIEGDNLTVTAPFWRTDIEIPEDIVEEVGRLYGYDHLPLQLPKRNIVPARTDPELAAKSHIRAVLAKAGANEVLTYSFVHGKLLERAGQDRNLAFELSNALSPDLQYYRLSLTPSLLDKAHANIKAGYGEFALFELGKAHGTTELDEDGLPKEFGRVGLLFGADTKLAQNQYEGAAYYQAQKYATNLLAAFGIEVGLSFTPVADFDYGNHQLFGQMLQPYNPQRAAVIKRGEYLVGVVGEYRHDVSKAFKLPEYCAGFELFLSPFTSDAQLTVAYKPLPRFPKVEQDMCLKLPATVTYQAIRDFVVAEIEVGRPAQTFTSVTPVDVYRREDDANHTQFTFRLAIASYEKTMTDTEVNSLLDTVAAAAKQKFGAERI